MQDKKWYLPGLDFFLYFREARLQIIDKEELSLLLILLALSHNIPQDIDLLLPVLIIMRIIKILKILPNLFVSLDIRANHIIAKRDILKKIWLC